MVLMTILFADYPLTFDNGANEHSLGFPEILTNNAAAKLAVTRVGVARKGQKKSDENERIQSKLFHHRTALPERLLGYVT